MHLQSKVVKRLERPCLGKLEHLLLHWNPKTRRVKSLRRQMVMVMTRRAGHALVPSEGTGPKRVGGAEGEEEGGVALRELVHLRLPTSRLVLMANHHQQQALTHLHFHPHLLLKHQRRRRKLLVPSRSPSDRGRSRSMRPWSLVHREHRRKSPLHLLLLTYASSFRAARPLPLLPCRLTC